MNFRPFNFCSSNWKLRNSVQLDVLQLCEPDIDFRGTITFGSTDGSATLPDAYTFTAADGGTKTFHVTLRSAGAQQVSVAGDLGTEAATVAVNAAAADRLQVDIPTSATAGAGFDVTVTALDPFGNVADGYTGTVTFQSTDTHPAISLPPDYTFTPADSGP